MSEIKNYQWLVDKSDKYMVGLGYVEEYTFEIKKEWLKMIETHVDTIGHLSEEIDRLKKAVSDYRKYIVRNGLTDDFIKEYEELEGQE